MDDLRQRARQLGALTTYIDQHGNPVHADDEALQAVVAAIEAGHGKPGQAPWYGKVPLRAWRPDTPKRDFGIFLPHHALRTRSTRGCGDLTALRALGEWAADQGAGLVGTLPLLPTFLHRDGPYEPSPYAPVSRRFWAEHLIDPTAAQEWDRCPEAQEILRTAEADGTLAALRGGDLVDPAGAWELQWALLQALAKVAWAEGKLANAVAYAVRHEVGFGEQLRTYARFRAATAQHGPWPTWADASRFDGCSPDRPLAWSEGGMPPVDETEVDAWVYAQMEARRQVLSLRRALEDRGIDLYLDLPIGTHPDGFDTFYGTGHSPLHAAGVSAGAPPDPYFPSGQDWGFPPVHPDVSRATASTDLRLALAHHAEAAHRLRIDHILGFYRMFWVPAGLGATRGVYVRYPADAWWDALVHVSHHAQCHMIGENLGMVPEELTRAMLERDVDGMHVGQFALKPDPHHPFEPPQHGYLTCLNTHDTPTFAGFWRGEDLDTHESLGWLAGERALHERGYRRWLCDQLRPLGGTGPLSDADVPEAQQVAASLYLRLAHSEAGTVLVNLEDLWAEDRPHNVPGTWRELPNWLRRSARTLEEVAADPHVSTVLAALAAARPRST